MLLTLLPVVVPIVAIVGMAAKSFAGDASIGDVVAAGITAAITVAIQLVFWFTLVFAVLERTADRSWDVGTQWTPDKLPALPAQGRPSLAELALSATGLVFAAVFIVWQQVAAPIAVGGQSYPVFDPALWSFWLPWFLVVIGLELVFTGLLYRAGRWTWPFAVANAILAAAFAIPALWLIQTDRLWNPAAVDALASVGLGDAIAPISVIIGVSIAVISAWDAVDGFLKASRTTGRRPPRRPDRPTRAGQRCSRRRLARIRLAWGRFASRRARERSRSVVGDAAGRAAPGVGPTTAPPNGVTATWRSKAAAAPS